MADLKPSDLDYGIIIAFVAPGFVAFHAASYQLPTAKAWMFAASDKDQSVGVFLFVLLASLCGGLIVSGVRALVIDNLLKSSTVLRKLAVPPYTIEWSRVDDKKLSVLVAIRDGHYRYYQFYSNTFVAIVFWISCRAFADGPNLRLWHWAVIVMTLFALLLSARDALVRYSSAVKQI
jgi:hypothetical protein